MESSKLQQIAESWFDAELDKTIFQESKEAALYYKEQYLATYRAGFIEGQKQAQLGAVWVKASERLPQSHEALYIKIEKGKSIGSWHPHHEMFVDDAGDFHPADQVEWLDESAAGREEDKAHFDNWHRWLSDNGYTYDGEYYYDEDNNYFTPDQLWVKFK